MIFGKVNAVYSPEGDGGASAATPPPAPPINPTDSNPDAISSEDDWVLGHFDNLNRDDASEEISQVVEPVSAIPAPAGIPEEGGQLAAQTPSEPTGTAPQGQPALATPVVVPVAQPPPVPQVGLSASQPVSGVAQQPPSAPDPTKLYAQIAEGIQQQRAAFIEKLAKDTYGLSEKETDEMGFTPEQAKAWARKLAEVHVNSAASITQMQAEQLPVFLNGMLEQRRENQKREDEFFGLWPQLKAVPGDELYKTFEAVNRLHPNLKGKDWMKKAGEIACISFNLPIQNPVAGNGAAVPQPTVRTPGPVVRQTNGLGHFPAGTSTTPAPLAPQKTEAERFFDLLAATDAGAFDN